MRLWRALPYNENAGDTEAGGALWFARDLQGAGRHDNPDLYGCMYVSEEPISAVAEQLAPFRGTGTLRPSMLVRFKLPLALVALDLPDPANPVDLDDPAALDAEGLLPSQVATRQRAVTQAGAAQIYTARRQALGIRWWSTLEASWANWTLFDRVAAKLALDEVTVLSTADPTVLEAADFLGLSP